jgi:hypothetical protein
METGYHSPGRAILSGFFVLCLLMAGSVLAETIPPDSWVYPALRTFELRGLVSLEPTIPYSRGQIESYVDAILTNLNGGTVPLGVREQYLLERLREEFVGTGGRPEGRENRPVYTVRDGDRYFAIDWAVGGSVLKRVDEEKGESDGLAVPRFLAGLGGGLTLEANYRLRMAPERGLNDRNSKPSPRTKSYRGLTAEYERALLSAEGSWWRLEIGRDYLQWGSGRSEGLILSETAGSLDHFGGRFTIGRFTVSTFQADLDPRSERRLAGHRLTVRLPRGAFFGIDETAVYQSRTIDYIYLLPLSVFYANQFNEAADDNILWSFDWKVPIHRGLLVYGEFLVDDLQYERDELAGPDKIAFNLSADALTLVGARELEISAGYTYIDIYTYTHTHDATAYLTGDGLSPGWDRGLGSPLGPDADRWNVAVSLSFHPRATFTAAGALVRRGEGNDYRRWYPSSLESPGPPSHPKFPSGVVLNERTISARELVDLGGGSYVSAGGGIRFLSGGPDNLDATDGFGYIELVLDL